MFPSCDEHIPVHIKNDSEYTSFVYSDDVIVASPVIVNSKPLNSNTSTFIVQKVKTVIMVNNKEMERGIYFILFSDRTTKKCLAR